MKFWQLCSAALNLFRRTPSLSSRFVREGRRGWGCSLEPLESRQLLSISGYVYVDVTGNNARDASEPGLGGVLLTLQGTDASNHPIATQTTTTASDGSYHFNGVAAGTYSITEAQPSALQSGTTSPGSLGGTANGNTISNIVVSDATIAATDYNFGEKPFDAPQISINYFLASTPSSQQIYNDVVTSGGFTAPFVATISKGSADPTGDNSVTFNVTFSKNVTGVSAADFSVVASSGITGAVVSGITGSGSAYTVTVNTGNGSGTLALKLVDDDSIVDASNQPLGGSGAGNGNFLSSAYTVNKVATVAITSVTSPINSANAASTTASGTGQVGATISLVASNGSNSTTAKTATVASDGTWSITGVDVTTLADGTITYTATSNDGAGHTSQATKTSTKDTVAPAVAISTVTDPVTSSNVSTATASGTGEAGATITLLVTKGTSSIPSLTTTVASNGTWSISGINLTTLPDGTVTFSAIASDAAGNTATANKTATKDTTAPTVNITAVTDPITIAAVHSVTASGTGEAGATLKLVGTDGTHSTSEYTGTVAQDGTWSITGIDTSALSDGTITFTVDAKDAANNTASDSQTATKTTLTVTTVTSPINAANQSQVSLSGTGQAGATVTVVATHNGDSTDPLTTTIGQNGAWSIDNVDVSSLADGTITFAVTATDAQNNSVVVNTTSNKDTLAPQVALSSVTDPVNLGNQTTTTASGTADVGAQIKLTATDGTVTTSQYTATVAQDGTWSINNIDVSLLANGTITYTVTATDTVGNVGTANKTAVKSTVAITSVTNPISSLNDAQVTISGTGAAGASISVVASIGAQSTEPVTATVAQDGTWSISNVDVGALDDGTLTFTVTSTLSGNTATATQTALKDTAGPEVILSTVTDPIAAANAAHVTATGTGEANAHLTLTASDGTNTTTQYTATIAQNGTWSMADIDVSDLSDGTITFTIVGTDSLGNFTTITHDAQKDTTGPVVAISNVTNPVTLANQQTTSANGTGDADSHISLVVKHGQETSAEYTTTIAQDGTWTINDIDVSSLSDGTITYTVTATDALGNATVVTHDATKTTVTITSLTDPINNANQSHVTISGNAPAGATISVVATNGAVATDPFTTTAGNDGAWSIEEMDVTPLDDGTITFTVTATHNGETGTATKTALMDTAAPAVAISTITDPIGSSTPAHVSVTGTAEAGAHISLVANKDAVNSAEYSATAAEDGTWTINNVDVSTLGDGILTFTATATDAVGNTNTDNKTATKDTVAPQVALVSVTDPITIALQSATTASGTGEAGDTIKLVATHGDGSSSEYQTTVDQDGNWTITDIDVSNLDDGTITYTVNAIDGAGNTGSDMRTATKTTVAITSITDPIGAASQSHVVITGTGQAGATVTVLVSDGDVSSSEYTTTIGQDGNWTIEDIDVTTLADGSLVFLVSADDGSGNIATAVKDATKDTQGPALLVESITDTVNIQSNGFADASGTSVPGATVQIVASDGNLTSGPFTTTVDQNGNWLIEGIDVSTLADGTITFSITATNGSGTTTKSASAVKDTVAPALQINSVTDPVVPANQANTEVQGTSDPGARITIVARDTDAHHTSNYIGFASQNGTWTVSDIDVSNLSEGVITYSITVNDDAGNVTSGSIDSLKQPVTQ